MSLFKLASTLEERGVAFVVITLVSGKGHVPQLFGAKALVTAEGLAHGTVGGGKVEARAIELGQELLAKGQAEPKFVTWNLAQDLDMTCGGEMSFLLETVFPHSWNVTVYGAGHVGQAVAHVLNGMRCRLLVVDPRAEWREKLPAGVSSQGLVKQEAQAASTFHVVVTQDHETDREVLREIFAAHPNPPYVGVIGSAAKAGKLRRELQALSVGDAFLERLRCPIGLRLGGNEPGEIAVSIAAELLQARDAAIV